MQKETSIRLSRKEGSRRPHDTLRWPVRTARERRNGADLTFNKCTQIA